MQQTESSKVEIRDGKKATVIHLPLPHMMAGRDDEKVRAILGDDIWQILSQSVNNGEVDALKMRDIAYKLHKKIGGGHLRRMGPGMKGVPDWFEFREILAHWHQLELCELEKDRGAVAEKLVRIFNSEEVQLPNLSRGIQQTMAGDLSEMGV